MSKYQVNLNTPNPDKPIREIKKVALSAPLRTKGDGSFGTKFRKAFFAEDLQTAFAWAAKEIVVPIVKGMVISVVTGTLEKMMYGNATVNNRANGYVNYSTYQGYNYKKYSQAPQQTQTQQIQKSNVKYTDLVFGTRVDAEQVIASMQDTAAKYGWATIGDLLECVGQIGQFTDNNFGWTFEDTKKANVQIMREGYIIIWPSVSVVN